MAWFSILYHFLLSRDLFDNSVLSVHTMHDLDILSNHEPLSLVLWRTADLITVSNRIPVDKVAWHKDNEDHLADCLTVISSFKYRCCSCSF